MYAGIGRTNSSNSSNPIESGAEIPEWKRLLIMRKRAGALAATTSSDEINSKTAVSAEPVCSHFRNPVASGRHGNLSGNCNVITGCCDSDLPPGLHTHSKFAPMLRSSASVTGVESERCNSGEPICQDTIVRTIGNITVELRTVHNRPALENGDDCVDGNSSPSADRFPLMSPSSSEPAYLVEEELTSEEPPEEETEDLQYGPGIVDKLRARFLNLGRKNRRRPVVRKFSSLENLSPGGYGTIRAIGPHNKLPKGEYRRSGIRATNLNHQHCVGSNFKKAQSMETLLVSSTASSQSSTPDSNFAPLRRGRLFLKSLSPGYASKYAPEITSQLSFQDSKKRFDYARQTSGSSINEAELPKPDTVKQVKKIFESPLPPTVNSKDGRPCTAAINNHSNEKSDQSRTTVVGTPTCTTPKALPSFNAIAMSGNIRPRKVPPTNNTITSTASSIILEEDVLISIHDDSAKPSNEVCGPQDSTITNGLTPNKLEACERKVGGCLPESSELVNETSLICKAEEKEDIASLSACRTNQPPCLVEGESFSAKSSDIIVSDNSLSDDSPTDSASYYDSSKVSSAFAERLPPIEQSNDCCGEKKELASQGSQVTTEPEQDYHVTSVTRKTPHLHQPDSPALLDIIDDSPTGEEDSQYDEVCEDDLEEDMVVASASQDGASPHHLRTRENHAAVASQPASNNLLIFNKKPSNWQKPPQPTTSVVFDFRGKDVKPNISLNPTPFGCKPAKVKKRTGSPPRGDTKVVNGVTNNDQMGHDVEDEDEEDWDEMDIGADLPALSGITFDGENVKVGRGALLEKRNKKLTIQFDDDATATFEYPCESPIEDYATDDSSPTAIKSSSAIGSYSANSSLSTYTPHVLGNSEEFQLGVSRTPTHRPPPPLPTKNESPVLTSASELIIPADPDDSSGWSATETTDILF